MSLMPFKNELYVDFSQPGPAEAMRKALAQVRSELGKHYPLVIGGEHITTEKRIQSLNPAKPSEIVGETSKANADLADRAIKVAAETFKTWRKVAPDERARYLLRAAAIMRRRIYEFSAWMCFDVSKNWIEAYADTCEAIDFMEFYAREMMRLAGSHPATPWIGEENCIEYLPLGVGVVIPPWNFPLAILVGMTTAALVTGNTVVLKPASTAPIIAAKFMELLEEINLPAGVVNFVPGPGGEVGDTLTMHPLTRFVSFTGSMDVGKHIFEVAAKVQPGQIWLKRTVLEMGGKDAMVIDYPADLTGAIRETAAAAFGFQGQKCSACSRLILHEKAYDEVLAGVAEKAKAVKIGIPSEENCDMGAVIDANAHKSILNYIEIGKKEGRIAAQSAAPTQEGYFVPATVIADVDRNSRVAQEEIFGPVLSVIKGKNFEDLMDIANGTQFGLTGGFMSNIREHLEIARRDFHVGNLYLNRKCTGAFVSAQPFGGFNMSGTDSKAGGSDYLQLFMQGKSICERF
jgi:1-pyrroline-5-carboxylate dehydrogenase